MGDAGCDVEAAVVGADDVPGWSELTTLTALVTGLSEAPLGDALAQLDAGDAARLASLRSSFAALAPRDAAVTLRALIQMMNSAMGTPVAYATELTEQAAPEAAAEPTARACNPKRKFNVMAAADKRQPPELWSTGSAFLDGNGANGRDLTTRARRMADKVEPEHGWPVADGCGCAIWCNACKKLQPLGRAFELANWNTHVKRKSHTDAVRELQESADASALATADWGMYA